MSTRVWLLDSDALRERPYGKCLLRQNVRYR